MSYIDRVLDQITMYRLLLYYLLILIGAAMLLGAFGYSSYSPQAIFIGAAYLTLVCWLINKLFAYVFEAAANPESSLITALILSLILTPSLSVDNFIFFSVVSMLAIASKYILTINRRHVFNPAAIAVALTAIAANKSASWWVGTTWLMPIVILGGLLLARKIRRVQMVVIFLVTSLIAIVTVAAIDDANLTSTIKHTFLHSSLFFLAFVMLTEPLTSPTKLRQQRWYSALAGLLFPPQLHVLGLYSTPELLLLVSNIFSRVISPNYRLKPKLIKKLSWGPSTKDYIFELGQKLDYAPGQYMEWTLPHSNADSRGSRRYFTLASSPTENNLRLGIKFYQSGSTFKQAMRLMTNNTPIAAGTLSGDFVLPKDTTRKLVFIAGGIGITPFRSMLKYLVDTHDMRTITLLYSERNSQELAYHDVIRDAHQQLGTKVVYTLTDDDPRLNGTFKKGRIDSEMIKAEVPDYTDRLFYISGSHSMVSDIKSDLRSLGVKDKDIKIDFFPGYV